MAEQAEKSKKITHTYLVNLKAMDGETQNIACGDGLSLRISPKRMSGIHLAIIVFSKGYRPKQGKVVP